MIAYIETEWTGDGLTTDTGYRPLLLDEYSVQRHEDITRQPGENILPSPNSYTIKVELDQATLDLIAADERFTILSVE